MMLNLEKSIDIHKARDYLDNLVKKKALIELTDKSSKTIKQNAYLHLLINYFALCYGDTAEYCKRMFFKIEANYDLFVYEKVNRVTGEKRKALKSTRDLTKDETITAIERFKNFSASKGYIMPDKDNKAFVVEVMQAIHENKIHL